MECHAEETTIEALTRMSIETPNPVSYYEEIHPLIERLTKKRGHTLTYDRKRTAYIRVEGEDMAKMVCVGAHLDTIGLMARHTNDNGILALRNLGGINYNNIEGYGAQMYTRDGNTVTGLFACTSHFTHVFDDARGAVCEESSMMVILDELVYSSDEVHTLGIGYGNIISIDPGYWSTKNSFTKSRFIDDKATAVVMFAALEDLQKTGRKSQCTTLLASLLYEETGHGGTYLPQEVSEYVTLDIDLVGPDYCSSKTKVSICAKDNYTPYDRALTTKLVHPTGDQKLDYSVNMSYHYGTDASAAICAGNNVYATAFGIGCFAPHDMERCRIQGAAQTARLLYAYLLSK